MPVTSLHTSPSLNSSGVSKLLTAAVVSSKFCKLLLTEPNRAIASGYNGETFHLESEELERILTIKAQSLAEFASQLIEKPGSSQPYRQPVLVRTDNRVFLPVGLD
jgi:hypothetical protein